MIGDKAFALYQRSLDFMRSRKQAYQLTFSTPHGSQMLTDLAKFCRANQSCWDPDPRVHAVLEGRREVFLRIASHLNLNHEQLNQLYGGYQYTAPQTATDEEALA